MPNGDREEPTLDAKGSRKRSIEGHVGTADDVLVRMEWQSELKNKEQIEGEIC